MDLYSNGAVFRKHNVRVTVEKKDDGVMINFVNANYRNVPKTTTYSYQNVRGVRTLAFKLGGDTAEALKYMLHYIETLEDNNDKVL